MDEKGFMVGCIGRSKRILSKTQWKQKRFKLALMNGNREWITLVACVGVSGEALPYAPICSAEPKNVQEAWVRDADKRSVADRVEHADKKDCRMELIILHATERSCA